MASELAHTAAVDPQEEKKLEERTSDIEKNVDGPAQQPSPSKPQPPPDGGIEAWLVVLASFLILFSTFGLLNAFGVWESYYLSELGFSSSQISWVGSVQLCLQFLLGPLVGILFDLGYFRALIAVGSVFYVVGLFTLSVCSTFWQVFLAQGLCMGVGSGCLFLPALSIIAHWFARRRPIASGISSAGGSLGGVVLPIMTNRMLEQRGFKITILALAGVVTGCLLIAQLLFKTRLPNRKQRIAANGPIPPVDARGIFGDAPFMSFVLGLFCVVLGLYIPIFFAQLKAQTSAIDPKLAIYTLPLLNAGSIPGRTLPNFIAQSTGALNMMVVSVFATGALCFAFLGSTNSDGALVIWTLLYGFFSGAYISLLAPATFRFAKNVEEIGARMGVAFLLFAIAALIGSPIAGYILGSSLRWTPVAVFSGVWVFAGGILILVSRTLRARKTGTQLV